MTTSTATKGGIKGRTITSQKQQARQVLLTDLAMTQYHLDESRDPKVKRGLAILYGLLESSLQDVEKIRRTHARN